MSSGFRSPLSIALLAVLLAAALPACSTAAKVADVHMMPMDQLPAQVRSAPANVRTAYQFAAANPDVLQKIPCYCGCGKVGHTSNYSCYVKSTDANGAITFDDHALGCGICVDITQGAMLLLKDGKSISEIKDYTVSHYSSYGPSNMP